jgi:hypothetical protein
MLQPWWMRMPRLGISTDPKAASVPSHAHLSEPTTTKTTSILPTQLNTIAMSAASIPTYFTTNADYKTWTLLAFLTAESAALKTPIDTEIKRHLGDAWNSTLLHYANDAENPRRAGWAERLRREWKDVSS